MPPFEIGLSSQPPQRVTLQWSEKLQDTTLFQFHHRRTKLLRAPETITPRAAEATLFIAH